MPGERRPRPGCDGTKRVGVTAGRARKPATSRCSGRAITLSARATAQAWGPERADHGEVRYATAEGNDYAAHEQTYRTFIHLVKGVLAAVLIIVILMAIFLV